MLLLAWRPVGLGAALLVLASLRLAEAAPEKPVCHDGAQVRVIERPFADRVGNDILVRRRQEGAPFGPCRFARKPGDTRLGGTDKTWPTDALFVTKLVEPYLFLDGGTGTLRRFIVYDLTRNERVYTAETSDEVVLDARGATLWVTAGEAKPSTCRDFAKFKAMGGSAAIVRKVVFDIATGAARDLGQTRCVYRE